MKFKLAHIYIGYELISFIYEMNKRKATSIKFEFQKSVGKFNIYIDDSSFKTIDGKIGWQIIRAMYSLASKKSKETFNKDEDFTSENTISAKELNKSFDFMFFPLTKGRCLSFSYKKKEGDLYEACLKIKSNNVKDILVEKFSEFQNDLSEDIRYFFIQENYEIETLFLKQNIVHIYIVDNNKTKDNRKVFKVNLSDITNKKKANELISKIKKFDIPDPSNDDVSW